MSRLRSSVSSRLSATQSAFRFDSGEDRSRKGVWAEQVRGFKSTFPGLQFHLLYSPHHLGWGSMVQPLPFVALADAIEYIESAITFGFVAVRFRVIVGL